MPSKAPSANGLSPTVHGVRRRLHDATDQLANGRMTVDAWADHFHDALVEGHRDAWRLGRQRAGDLTDEHADDLTMGREMADREGEWLGSFVEDLQNGRYTDEEGNLKAGAVKVRQDLYAQKLRGTANEAFVSACDDDEEFDWELGGAEQHCEDCPRIAAGSPYTKDTLYTHPCGGDTECLGHCDCTLRRKSDGRTGFTAVDLEDE